MALRGEHAYLIDAVRRDGRGRSRQACSPTHFLCTYGALLRSLDHAYVARARYDRTV